MVLVLESRCGFSRTVRACNNQEHRVHDSASNFETRSKAITRACSISRRKRSIPASWSALTLANADFINACNCPSVGSKSGSARLCSFMGSMEQVRPCVPWSKSVRLQIWWMNSSGTAKYKMKVFEASAGSGPKLESQACPSGYDDETHVPQDVVGNGSHIFKIQKPKGTKPDHVQIRSSLARRSRKNKIPVF